MNDAESCASLGRTVRNPEPSGRTSIRFLVYGSSTAGAGQRVNLEFVSRIDASSRDEEGRWVYELAPGAGKANEAPE